ncbi:MAG TPA: crossover junction endodeoxyribonuclease RuvC [bacterium]|jgi:crossover junction endodeoxyribonuclease RuvC|nr:MAG: Crossover junction endodeoxyribonuclease RuvC [Parcubacteria group bacterium ADurb.Bin115]HNU81228.1 crossover junction endodeoxyribonuclease RuvC [bacterium]HOD86879.1 crossover junction endodeoxyribonuclease RuvC [bacterium]HPW05497.1 crossover junction endodeoxyribonuclease RuvC [bacterium]HPY99211.1 crossover junction endodeoxyribonuclease RuvC [bacterium]
MEKIIFGIDPGIADTGYGFIRVQGGNLECLDYGSIKTPAGQPLPERLQSLYQELRLLLEKYRPQVAAVEQLFFNKNVRTALIVGQARGVALLAVSQQGIPLLDFTPAQVKRAVSAYGQASKLQIQKMVKLILKLEEIPKPDDAADALAVAICGANQRQWR